VSSPFLGQIIPVSFNFPPKGYAFCDGSFLAINQNQAIFSLLGTTYGGNGVQNFALPDLRSRVPMHRGNGHTLGEAGGTETVTLNGTQIASHSHTVSQPASKDEETTNRPDGAYFTVGGAFAGSNNAALGGTTTSNVGGNQAHTNVQPYLAIPFVIALQGVFPSQN
jgi:microcystin-dependent protein